MPDNINSLIATFPERIQNNALRSAQTELANQNVQQNALKLYQQRAGMNALQDAYANSDNLDPTTGMLRPRAMGSVIQANPALGLDMTEALGRLNEYQIREQMANLKTREYYAGLFREEVADPAVLYSKQLRAEKPNLPEEQYNQMIDSFVHNKIDETEKAFALPSEEAQRWGYLKPNIPQWEFQSKLWADRQKTLVDENLKIAQTGAQQAKADETKTLLQPKLGATEAKTALDRSRANTTIPMIESSGLNKGPISYHPGSDTYTKKDAQGNDVIINPINPVKIGTKDAGALGSTEQIRIQKPDGKTEVISAQPAPRQPGEPVKYYDSAGNLVPANTILATKIPPSVTNQPQYSQDALDVISDQILSGDPSALRSMWGAPSLKVQITNDFSAKAKALWDKDAGANLAAMNAMFSGQEGALKGLDKLRSNVESFEGTALREANQALDLSRTVDRGSAPILNRWVLAGRKAVSGDAGVTNLDNAVNSFVSEYARIMSNPGASGGVTSDHARDDAKARLSSTMNQQQFESAVSYLKAQMKNRVNSIQSQIGLTIGDIQRGGGIKAPLGVPEENPPSAAPVGTSSVASGFTSKTYTSIDQAKKDLPNDNKWYTLGTQTWRKRSDGTLEQR